VTKGIQPGETVVTDATSGRPGGKVELRSEPAGGENSVNIAESFIRRPLQRRSLCWPSSFRHHRISSTSGERPSQRGFPYDPCLSQVARSQPGNDGLGSGHTLERQFSTIAGLDSMTSTNGLGISEITLQFTLNRDMDAAAQDVQTAIARAVRILPANMPHPPSFHKVNPADQAVLYLALSSPTLPLSTVHEYAETLLAQRISMVSGVAQVQVQGAQSMPCGCR